MSLKDKTVAEAYKSLLRVDDNTNGIDGAIESVTDGEGTKAALFLSDDHVQVRPNKDDTTSTFAVRAAGGTSLLRVDSTNSVVTAGVGGFNVLTQYAYFSEHFLLTTANTAGYHYPLTFGSSSNVGIADQINIFGNGTDPAATVTTPTKLPFSNKSSLSSALFCPYNGFAITYLLMSKEHEFLDNRTPCLLQLRFDLLYDRPLSSLKFELLRRLKCLYLNHYQLVVCMQHISY